MLFNHQFSMICKDSGLPRNEQSKLFRFLLSPRVKFCQENYIKSRFSLDEVAFHNRHFCYRYTNELQHLPQRCPLCSFLRIRAWIMSNCLLSCYTGIENLSIIYSRGYIDAKLDDSRINLKGSSQFLKNLLIMNRVIYHYFI